MFVFALKSLHFCKNTKKSAPNYIKQNVELCFSRGYKSLLLFLLFMPKKLRDSQLFGRARSLLGTQPENAHARSCSAGILLPLRITVFPDPTA